MMNQIKMIKGNIIDCDKDFSLRISEKSYLLWNEEGIIGRYTEEELPDSYRHLPLIDYKDNLILPGMTDLHIHAPQYAFRGVGADLELLDWLNCYTFLEEAKYKNENYARDAYRRFVKDLKASFTCRACIFATIHLPATKILMDFLEESGLITMVGKVNMDRNCMEELREKDAKTSVEDTERWIEDCKKRYKNTRAIITPRFIPSCSDGLIRGLAGLRKRSKAPAQTHLSENPAEVSWVAELCPDSDFYLDAYDKRGLLEGSEKNSVIMAHCVYSGEEEIEMLREKKIFVAHCPQSNTNLSSGIAPVREFLNRGIKIGLGSDIAAGHSISLLRIAAEAIAVSKLRWRILDPALKPLGIEEAFYILTRGGGEFFGKVGAFEEGFAADILVLDDEEIRVKEYDSPKQRLERVIYLSENIKLRDKYIAGRKIDLAS